MADKKTQTVAGLLVTRAPELSLADLCESCGLSKELVIGYVSEGIIEPEGEQQGQWRFSRHALIKVRRAARLEQDLGLNRAGVALALDLMKQIEQLKQRLERYELSAHQLDENQSSSK